jgi:hypothetical protein
MRSRRAIKRFCPGKVLATPGGLFYGELFGSRALKICRESASIQAYDD